MPFLGLPGTLPLDGDAVSNPEMMLKGFLSNITKMFTKYCCTKTYMY
jgi:hypothetical protein